MFLLRYPNISTTQMERLAPEVPLNQYDSIGAIYYTFIIINIIHTIILMYVRLAYVSTEVP